MPNFMGSVCCCFADEVFLVTGTARKELSGYPKQESIDTLGYVYKSWIQELGYFLILMENTWR